MIVEFNLPSVVGKIAEYKLDAPPRVDEYVILNTGSVHMAYKVESVINTYPLKGRNLTIMSVARVIVYLRRLDKEEEEYVISSKPVEQRLVFR